MKKIILLSFVSLLSLSAKSLAMQDGDLPLEDGQPLPKKRKFSEITREDADAERSTQTKRGKGSSALEGSPEVVRTQTSIEVLNAQIDPEAPLDFGLNPIIAYFLKTGCCELGAKPPLPHTRGTTFRMSFTSVSEEKKEETAAIADRAEEAINNYDRTGKWGELSFTQDAARDYLSGLTDRSKLQRSRNFYIQETSTQKPSPEESDFEKLVSDTFKTAQ